MGALLDFDLPVDELQQQLEDLQALGVFPEGTVFGAVAQALIDLERLQATQEEVRAQLAARKAATRQRKAEETKRAVLYDNNARFLKLDDA